MKGKDENGILVKFKRSGINYSRIYLIEEGEFNGLYLVSSISTTPARPNNDTEQNYTI